MLCAVVTLLTIKCVLAVNTTAPLALRIYNGYEAGINSYPYAVFLHFDKTNPKSCGGSLIMVQAVLTAARCLDELRVRKGKIRAHFGHTIPVHSKMIIEVADYEVHPKYNEMTGFNNLGIAFLKKRVNLQASTKKIPLVKKIPPAGTELWTAGWGYQYVRPRYEASLSLHRSLRSTRQELISSKVAGKHIGHNTYQSSVYTWQIKGEHASDDAGDGLIMKTPQVLLVGVLSHVVGEISVYTNVIHHREWIRESLEKLHRKVCLGKKSR